MNVVDVNVASDTGRCLVATSKIENRTNDRWAETPAAGRD
jgi:hypothetical protein